METLNGLVKNKNDLAQLQTVSKLLPSLRVAGNKALHGLCLIDNLHLKTLVVTRLDEIRIASTSMSFNASTTDPIISTSMAFAAPMAYTSVVSKPR